MVEKILDQESEKKLDPKVIKEVDDIKQVIQDITQEFHNYEFPKYIGNYKKYLGFVADRIASIDAWQSNVDYPLVSAVVDTMFGNIFDFGYEFGINEAKLKRICTEAFDFRGTGKATFKEVAKEILICGKGYVKDYLLKEDNTEKFFGKELKQTIKTPSMFYVSIFDVMYDRTKGLSKSPYKVIRTFSTGDAIKAKVLPILLEEYGDDQKKTVIAKIDKLLKLYKEDFGSRFSIFDYNPVKSLTSTTQFMNADSKFSYDIPLCNDRSSMIGGIEAGGSAINDETKDNYFLNMNKSTYELVEYSTNNRKAIFINGNLLFIGNKHHNLGEVREANFSLVPGTGNANGVADNLGGLQDINNSLWNSFLDNIKLVLGPMFKISGNMPIGKNGTIDFKKFKAFRTNGSTNIEKVQLGVTDFAPINFMQIVQAFAEQRSGVSNYIMGGQGSIERVSGGIDMKFNQYKSKLTPITDSIDQMMGNIARSWILMYFKFFTKEELTKMGLEIVDNYIKDENGKDKFDTFLINGIDIKTIIDEKNITFTYNSLNKLTKENSRSSIKEVLPALLQYASADVNMTEMVKLLAGQDFNPEKLIYTEAEKAANKSKQNQGFQGYAGQEQGGGGYMPQGGGQEQGGFEYPNNYEGAASDKFRSQYDTAGKGVEKYASAQPTYEDYSDEDFKGAANSIS